MPNTILPSPSVASTQLELIGPHPFAQDAQGRQFTRIGTLFPQHGVLYTRPPGVHALQRLNFMEHLNALRASESVAPLTMDEEVALCERAVDLVFESDHLLIRPDPGRIELALLADDMLQELIPKFKIRFLSVGDPRVREAIKRRGEYWRLSFLPKTLEGKKRLVFGSKVAIGGLPIYYYNRLTGTRWLTFEEFESVGRNNDPSLALHLQEIADHSTCQNHLGRPEIDFFATDLRRFSSSDFAGVSYRELSCADLRAQFEKLKTAFRAAVHQEYARNDFQNRAWCERIISTLFLEGDEAQTEHILTGLSREFFMQVQWLPGGRFEEGEFLLDSVFHDAASQADNADVQSLCDSRAREIILNFIRDHGDLEYINLGCIPESMSLDRPQVEGRRGVYLAEFQVRGEPAPMRVFLRLQKWGVWQHLDEGKDLLSSIQESDEYTDYSLDRRLGCRQLGMNLSRRAVMRRLNEIYLGSNQRYRGQVIRTTYFERDYVPGIATDKLPMARYERPGYATIIAAMLGRAAASSMIVGRSLEDARPAFDDGDEVVLEGADGLPLEILVADHSGAFTEYALPLESFAADYARPVNRRDKIVPNAVEFAQAYVDAFGEHFAHVQGDYRKRRGAFDHLFTHRKYDTGGSFAYRWESVLHRLDHTDAQAITAALRCHIHVLNTR